jgi:hypothetical protein
VSLEWLLLLAFFVLLPLVERLLRTAREQRAARRPEQPQAARPAAPSPVMPRPQRAEQPVPRRPPAAAILAPPQRQGRPRVAAVADLLHAVGLRRAIIVMTILGPCRALSPHTWEGVPDPIGRSTHE